MRTSKANSQVIFIMEAIQFLDVVGEGRKALCAERKELLRIPCRSPLIKLFLHHLFIKIPGIKNEYVGEDGWGGGCGATELTYAGLGLFLTDDFLRENDDQELFLFSIYYYVSI